MSIEKSEAVPAVTSTMDIDGKHETEDIEMAKEEGSINMGSSDETADSE
jgi:hypothetical protein